MDSNIFWGIISIAASLLISTVYFIASLSRKILEFKIDTTSLVTKKMTQIPGLTLAIHDQTIKSLYSTSILFVNVGNQTIESEDFSKLDPLIVRTTGRFFGCDGFSNAPSAFPSITAIDDKTYCIDFEYIKKSKIFQ